MKKINGKKKQPFSASTGCQCQNMTYCIAPHLTPVDNTFPTVQCPVPRTKAQQTNCNWIATFFKYPCASVWWRDAGGRSPLNLLLNFPILCRMRELYPSIPVIFHIYIESAYLKTNNLAFLMPVAVLIATDLLFTEHTTAARAEEHPILPLMDGQAGELNPPAILPHSPTAQISGLFLKIFLSSRERSTIICRCLLWILWTFLHVTSRRRRVCWVWADGKL